MSQAKAKASLGASLLQSKRGAARLPPPEADAPSTAELAPGSPGALQGSGVFFQKGVASAAGFRPNYWSYEKDPAPKPARLAVLPGGAAETTKVSALAQALATPAEPSSAPPRLTLLAPAGDEPTATESAPNVIALAITPAPQAAAVDDRESAPPAAEPHIEVPAPTVRVLEERIEVLEEKVERIEAPLPPPVTVPREEASLGPAEVAALLAVAEDHQQHRAEPVAGAAPAPPRLDSEEARAEEVPAQAAPPAPPPPAAPVRLSLLADEAPFAFKPPAPPAEARLAALDRTIAPMRDVPAPLPMPAIPAPAIAPAVDDPALAMGGQRPDSNPAGDPLPAAPAEVAAEPELEPVARSAEPEPAPAMPVAEPEPRIAAPERIEYRAPPVPARAEAPPIAERPGEPAPSVSTVDIKETLLAELGAAIESVMSKRWYGMPSGTPLAPAGSIPATLPTIDHSSLIAELAAANPIAPPPPPEPRRLPLDIIVAGLVGGALALGYVFWGIPAPLAGAFRELVRFVS